jgi:two-component system, sensor histidine kinase and response regulator
VNPDTHSNDTVRILVVDDHQTNLDIVRSFLQFEGYDVVEAHDGREAIEKAEAVTPDLVLLDILMPRLDGYETCRILKSRDNTRFVPVIMLTALQDTEDRVKGLDAGADDFVSKPFQAVELLARVRSLLKTKRLHDELERSLERLRLQNEELMRLEELREGLMELIVHDMNNPLTNVIGNLDLMGRMPPPLSDMQQESLEFARAAAKRLMRMVRNLLETSRLEEGALEIHRGPTEIDTVVREVVESLKLPLIRPGIEVDVTLEPARLMLDQTQFERVVSNLLDAALKYSRSGDTVRIAGALDSSSDRYVLRLAENGPIIPPEYREAVFDKFHQVKAREAGIPRGLALGLAYCRLVTEAHGGSIWIEGAGEKGNVYCLSLPARVD